MKNLLFPILTLSIILLTGCASEGPMTEEQQAAEYGLTIEEFREEKKAAARMNMSLDEHMKMLEDGHDMEMMDHN